MLTKTRFFVLSAALLLAAALWTPSAAQEKAKSDYRSPYSVSFTVPLKELTGDLDGSERGDFRKSSTVPFADWAGMKVRDGYGAWGPPARHFSALQGQAARAIDWQRQRVIAVALRYQGYSYQHHHLPDWDPPKDWPWKEVKEGRNGKGVDCSNFTSFAYNLGLGYKPTSAIKKQGDEFDVPGPGPGKTTRARRIDRPAGYAELVRTLKTGDLLFIRNKMEEISHVVLWIGELGESPDHGPLVLDSHGAGVKDANGNEIPSGVYLRPFRQNSWYYQSSSHALRILQDAKK